MKTPTLLLSLVSLLLLCSGSAAQAPPAPGAALPQVFDPRKPGPFPAGVTTTVFVDASRIDNVTKKPRTLVTEIWYPATDETRSLAKNRYADFYNGRMTPQVEALIQTAYRKPVEEIDRLYWNESVRDARVRAGKFPLVVFSHGNGGSRFQNTFWCDYLASHGYIVVAPDHTGNARLTVVDGELIAYRPSERKQSAADRPHDLVFLLDQMARWNSGGDSRFSGRMDLEKVAAAGMSFGALSALNVADTDPRVRAVVAMALGAPNRTNTTVPTLLMLGEKDTTIGAAGNELIRRNHQNHSGPSFLLELKQGGHFSFTDMFKINPTFGNGVGPDFTPMGTTYQIINACSVAFLGAYLKGEGGYAAFLGDNHWPEAVEWSARK